MTNRSPQTALRAAVNRAIAAGSPIFVEQPAYVVPALFLQVGTLRREVESYAEASELFCAARDVYGGGASKTPTALLVYEDGRIVGHVGYNGRVWAGEPGNWSADTALFYDNRDTIKTII